MFSHCAPWATKVVPAALLFALVGCQIVPPAPASAVRPLEHWSATDDLSPVPATMNAAPADNLPAASGDLKSESIQLVSGQETPRQTKGLGREAPSLADRLRMPDALPGSRLAPPKLPVDALDQPEKIRQAVEAMYPDLPKLAPRLPPLETAVQPLDLAALEQFALEHHPVVRQANADVQSAIGTMVQAGLHPNPSFGYEADTVNTGRTRGYQGVLLTQTVKTAGKLDLQKSSATMNLFNAQLAQAKATVTVRSQVRRAYFALLTTQEQERVAEALAEFTQEVYRVQVDQLKSGQAAPYEPMQLRALTLQSRGAILQARNRAEAARNQLAAALGLPDSVPPEIAGTLDWHGPRIDRDAALQFVFARHSDLLAARNIVHKARYDLRLAEVTPIPDLNFYTAIQKDYTTPPFATTYNLQVFVPVPVFDRNQGAIRAASGLLVRASEEERRLQSTLTADFSRVFERFRTSRDLLLLYRDQIIPDQSRAYRGVYERHQQEPDKVTFGEIVTAQQTLANSITIYLVSLNDYWAAVVDLAELLQLDDVFTTIPGAWELSVDVPPMPQAEPNE